MLHTHMTAVVLYVLIFIIKVYLLLFGKPEALASFRKKTKVIGEMVLPTFFLATGIYLAFNSGSVRGADNMWFIVKMVLLVVSIPLGIIAFKRNSKVLAVFTLLIFVYMFGISETKSIDMKKNGATVIAPAPQGTSVDGKTIFESNCVVCHGADGVLGMSGAANLQTSKLPDEEVLNVITNGKNGTMAAYKDKLSAEQIKAVADYVKTLRK